MAAAAAAAVAMVMQWSVVAAVVLGDEWRWR
jgi:hypothetical protein